MALGESRTSPISADVKRDPATPRPAEPPFGCNMSFEPWQLLLSIVAGWIHDEQQKIIEYQRTVIQVLQEKNGKKRILLNDDQRRRLAVKGKVLGRKLLNEIGTLFTPDTILRWHRELVAQKWDHSDSVVRWADQQRRRKSSTGSCNWPARIRPGVTTGSPTPWPTSGTSCPTKRSATS